MAMCFEERQRIGIVGETLLQKHLCKTLKGNKFLLQRINVVNQYIEGADFEVSFITVGEPVENAPTSKRVGLIKTVHRIPPEKYRFRIKGCPLYVNGARPVRIVAGGVESKTYNLKSFLKDNTYPNVLSGSLRIPIWQKADPPYTWFQRIAYPHELYRKEQGDSKRSLALVFVIEDWRKPLFSIAFTDVSAFIRRVFDLMDGLDIKSLHEVPLEILDPILEKKGIKRVENLMYIPLMYLEDLATVTWVNANSVESLSAKEPGELYRVRLEHLDMLAAGRRFSDTEPEDILCSLNHPLMDLVKMEMKELKKDKSAATAIRKGISLD